MDKWEYSRIIYTFDGESKGTVLFHYKSGGAEVESAKKKMFKDNHQEMLNKYITDLGSDGWELVSVVPFTEIKTVNASPGFTAGGRTTAWHFWFKRKL